MRDGKLPEGHTLHYAARQQRRDFAGEKLSVLSPQGRFRDSASVLDGQRLEDIRAYGKHLFYHWEEQQIVHVHLGLYGRFRRHASPPPEPRGEVRLRLVGRRRTLDLHGPSACEIISPQQHTGFLTRLGPDPLDAAADSERAWQRICKSRAAIGKLLLDQSVIAGIGNVYRAELLFALRIHPERQGRALRAAEFDELWNTIRRWMKIGAQQNRIITVDCNSKKKSAGQRERLAIYKKEHCSSCGGAVASWSLGARTIYACTSCQRR